jgi:hypothetical protein
MHYVEACSFMGADEILSRIEQDNVDVEEAINNSNAKSQELAG